MNYGDVYLGSTAIFKFRPMCSLKIKYLLAPFRIVFFILDNSILF